MFLFCVGCLGNTWWAVESPGVTRGDIEGDFVANGERDGEKLGDMAEDVLNVAPEASWLIGDRGSIMVVL